MDTKSLYQFGGWSLIGVLVTIGIFLWTEYRNPYNIEFSIEEEFNLFDINERISGLEIKYESQDLLDSKSVIKIIGIEITNLGDVITKQHYDANYPFGLEFKDARILEAEVNKASDDYIKNNIISNYQNSVTKNKSDSSYLGVLRLGKLILNSDDYAQLKITLLVSQNKEYGISVFGKIANIQDLKVTNNLVDQDKESVLGANPWMIYIIIGYFAFFAILYSYDVYKSKKKYREKKENAEAYLESNPDLTQTQKRIIEIYVEDWKPLYTTFLSYLFKKYEVIDLRDYVEDIIKNMKQHYRFNWSKARRDIKQMTLPKEIFETDGQVVTINQNNKEFIKKFFYEMDEIDKKNISIGYFDHS